MRALLRPQTWLRALEAVQSLSYMPLPKVQHARAHSSISIGNLCPVTLLSTQRAGPLPSQEGSCFIKHIDQGEAIQALKGQHSLPTPTAVSISSQVLGPRTGIEMDAAKVTSCARIAPLV